MALEDLFSGVFNTVQADNPTPVTNQDAIQADNSAPSDGFSLSGVFDDIRARASNAFESMGSTVGEVLKRNVTSDNLIQIGKSALGNLTAKQISQGARGSAPGAATSPSIVPTGQLARAMGGGDSIGGVLMQNKNILLIGGALILGVALLRK